MPSPDESISSPVKQPATAQRWLVVFVLVLAVMVAALVAFPRLRHKLLGSGLGDRLHAAAKHEGYDGHLHYLTRGSLDYREVALTIDDGPHPEWLPTILKALKKHQVHATFFLVGKMVKAHPELAKQIVAEGHELGDHSMNHPRFDTITIPEVKQEILDCAAEIQKATGVKVNLVRPPGVRLNEKILVAARDLGFTTIAENAGAHDFILEGDYSWYPGHAGFEEHVKKIVTDIDKQLKNGVIIDLHDMPATAYAMDALVADIESRGYKIVTASQLLAHARH